MSVMRAFQRSCKEDAFITGFSIRNAYSWDEVLLTAGMAKEKYDAKAKGIFGTFVKLGRKTGENADAILPFMEVFPQGDYTSVAFGGYETLICILKLQA